MKKVMADSWKRITGCFHQRSKKTDSKKRKQFGPLGTSPQGLFAWSGVRGGLPTVQLYGGAVGVWCRNSHKGEAYLEGGIGGGS